jgi:hypothetical protein
VVLRESHFTNVRWCHARRIHDPKPIVAVDGNDPDEPHDQGVTVSAPLD